MKYDFGKDSVSVVIRISSKLKNKIKSELKKYPTLTMSKIAVQRIRYTYEENLQISFLVDEDNHNDPPKDENLGIYMDNDFYELIEKEANGFAGNPDISKIIRLRLMRSFMK